VRVGDACWSTAHDEREAIVLPEHGVEGMVDGRTLIFLV
jgi:hypothetical protein